MKQRRIWRWLFIHIGLALSVTACSLWSQPTPSVPKGFAPALPTVAGQAAPAETLPLQPAATPPAESGANPVALPPTQPPLVGQIHFPLVQFYAPPRLPLPEPGHVFGVWADPNLPPALRQGLVLPQGWALTADPAQAVLRLEPGADRPVSVWLYALVTPFPNLSGQASASELQAAWLGQGPHRLLMDERTLNVLTRLWGSPGAGAITPVPAASLVDQAWALHSQPGNAGRVWAIIPFEDLEPRWKVLALDGRSPLRKDFDPVGYPLAVPISITGDPSLADTMYLLHGPRRDTRLAPLTNRDPARLTVVAMTGVTALVRATAFAMEQQGVRYPGQDIGAILRSADITHVSNEVPFAEDCPFPNPTQPDMRFCSASKYIELLEDVGTDVVELTGDHFQDWGAQAMLFTLDLYKARGWGYYGGGANADEARTPLIIEHNGNRLAFIGCNAKGGGYAQAGPDRPGAVVCGDWMPDTIARLRAEGYLPIATFQHFEYYTYRAQPNQERDFRRMAEAGALVVSGSQAHQPQGIEFASGAFIHYGLGNLFFDQYDVSQPCRQGFIDQHVFYAGRYLGVELVPILFIDYARARPMTPDEQAETLQAVFQASGW